MDKGTRDRGGRSFRLNALPPRLLFVTDDRIASQAGFLADATAVVEACEGRCSIQLRAHRMSGGGFHQLAAALRPRCESTGAELWINDRVDVAVVARADGVQLGARSMPLDSARRLLGSSFGIGYSAHGITEVEEVLNQGVDLVILGTVFTTPSHPERSPIGLSSLAAAAAGGRPILGIGGITIDRVKEIIAAGGWGVAVRGGVWEADDPGAAASEYLAELERALER